MEIHPLLPIPNSFHGEKLHKRYGSLNQLLSELRKRELPASLVSAINNQVEQVNAVTANENALSKQLLKAQTHIVRLVEKEVKLVPKKYYQRLWLALGMSVFGLPAGLVFGISIGNMALFSIGLPIGMGIGVGVGTAMDKKALQEGRQLDMELTY